MGFTRILLAAGLAASPCLAASASDPAPQLQQFVGSEGYLANINRLMAELPPAVFRRCDALVSNGSRVTVIEPVRFSAAGVPVSGSWKHSFPVSGCGNDTVINLYFRGNPGGSVSSIVGVPGRTRANLILQRDALHYASMSAAAASPGCGQVEIKDSRPIGPVGAADQPWQEDWTAAACGRTVRVPMRFIPDATGATISAGKAVPVR